MSDLRVTNLKGRNAGEAPTLPDGVVITGIATVSSVIVGTGITLSSSGINVTGVITATSFSGNGANLTGVGGTSVFAAGTAAAPSISPTGDSNTGIFFPAADTVAISEGGTEALRVDSSGRLLVGTSSYASNGIAVFQGNTSISTGAGAVDIRLGTTRPTAADTAIGFLRFMSTSDAASNYQYAAISAASDGASSSDTDIPGRLVFSTTADGAFSPTEAMRINNQQELLVGTATRTANGGKLQLSSGITFPATAVAATDVNTLDDYEEGTWTPQLTGFTMSGSNQGKYIKVGRVVTVEGVLQWSSGTLSGSASITGLPFANSGGTRSTGAFGFSNGAAIVPNSGFTWMTVHIDVGGTALLITQNGTAGHNHNVTIAASGVVFGFGLTYISA